MLKWWMNLEKNRRVIDELEDQLAKLNYENAKIISENVITKIISKCINKEMTEQNDEKSRAIEELAELRNFLYGHWTF